jgi:hypothetical protein
MYSDLYFRSDMYSNVQIMLLTLDKASEEAENSRKKEENYLLTTAIVYVNKIIFIN